jgi:FMN phosphatase YigB (HAD superfamily)
MSKKLNLSNLPKTWIFDIDGTIIEHNSHLYSENTLLPNVKNFWKKIPKKDKIIILTARENKYKKETVNFLKKNNLRFDHILFGLNIGERILINDLKPDGLKTAYAINLKRNQGTKIEF